MDIDDIKTMSVSIAERTIAINGEGYVCLAGYFNDLDPNLKALQWHPERQGRCKGTIFRHQGGSHGIDDFAPLLRFIQAWEDGKARKLAAVALAHAEAAGAFTPAGLALAAAEARGIAGAVFVTPKQFTAFDARMRLVERVADEDGATLGYVVVPEEAP